MNDYLAPRISFKDQLRFSSTTNQPPLCEVCSSMTIAQLRSREGFKHHEQARLLRKEFESKHGCPLCSLMWSCLSEGKDSNTFRDLTGGLLNLVGKPGEFYELYKMLKGGRSLNVWCPVTVFLTPSGESHKGEHKDGKELVQDDGAMQELQVRCAPKVVGGNMSLSRSAMAGLRGPGLGGQRGAIWEALDLLSVNDRKTKYEELMGKFSRLKWKGSLMISTDRESPVDHLVTYKKVPTDAHSDVAFRTIQSWLNKCVQSHCNCPNTSCSSTKYGATLLPTRVVDVGPADGSEEPRLCIPGDAKSNSNPGTYGNYTALSYCWGKFQEGGPSYTTTSSSLNEQKKCIPMRKLPRTVQDAITITRRLDIRYLWVDALCILQGSDKEARADWQKESARMAQVYGGAYLTIAAAAASDVYQGIFFKRDDPNLQKTTALELRSAKTPEACGKVYLGPMQRFTDSIDQPLYRRGWALQERILSPRVLICNKDQFVWECQSERTTESGVMMHSIGAMRLNTAYTIPVEILLKMKPQTERGSEKQNPKISKSTNILDNPVFKDFQDREKRRKGQRSDENITREVTERMNNSPINIWQCIVTEYTSRSLTNKTDKLSAISGLSRSFATFYDRTENDYLAGLWRQEILDNLLWAHCAIDIGHKIKRRRSKEYRAPSWSWAAVDGNIRYPFADRNGSGKYHTSFIDSHVEVSEQDPFGQVRGGCLWLRGPMRRIDRLELCDDEEASASGARSAICYHRSGATKFNSTFLDMSSESGVTELEFEGRGGKLGEIWLLRVKDEAIMILGLEKETGEEKGKGERVFHRLGIVFSTAEFERRWFRSCGMEKVKIV